MIEIRQEAVEEDVNAGDKNRDQNVGNEVHPGLNLQIWVVQDVELHQDLRHRICDGCHIKDPAEEVDGSGEEAQDAAPSRTRSNRSQVEYTSRGWN